MDGKLNLSMLKLHHCWLIQQSFLVTVVLGSVLSLPAFAQLPTFAEPETFPTPESEIAPVTRPEVLSVPEPEVAPATAPQILPTTSPEFVRPSYILGPGDQVEITVFEYEEFTGPQIILPDGTITLPIIGAVQAANRTPETLAQELTVRLGQVLVNPVVSIKLSVLRPALVNIAGEVHRPGPLLLRSTATNPVNDGFILRGSLLAEGVSTISSALRAAGGVTQNADLRQIVLRRSLPGGNSITTTINFWDALGSEKAAQDLIVQDGDSIFVPRLAADAAIDRRLIAKSTLAPNTVRVRVVGQVTRPGQIDAPPNSSISSAVAIAGGPTDDAKLSQVTLIRLNEEGAVETQELDLRSFNDSYQIQEGDVIIVPKTNISSILDFAFRLNDPWDFLSSFIRFLDPDIR